MVVKRESEKRKNDSGRGEIEKFENFLLLTSGSRNGNDGSIKKQKEKLLTNFKVL